MRGALIAILFLATAGGAAAAAGDDLQRLTAACGKSDTVAVARPSETVDHLWRETVSYGAVRGNMVVIFSAPDSSGPWTYESKSDTVNDCFYTSDVETVSRYTTYDVSNVQPNHGENFATGLAAFALIGGLGILYFSPSMVAFYRPAKARGGVFVVNLFLGWTLLGWVAALAWACGGEKEAIPEKAVAVQ